MLRQQSIVRRARSSGKCYGAEASHQTQFGRVSYAAKALARSGQVCARIDETTRMHAKSRKNCAQAAYRRLQSDHLFHPLTSREGLEASVLKLRTDLTRLRRGVKQWAAGVAILLVISVGLGIWLLYNQRQTTQRVVEAQNAMVNMSQEMTKLREGILKYPRIEAEVRGLDLLAPSPAPAVLDPAKLVVRITRAFARFAKQPFQEKRDLLRTAFREIVLDHGTIPSLTLNGAFLDLANLATPS